jgi:hypothetical protein
MLSEFSDNQLNILMLVSISTRSTYRPLSMVMVEVCTTNCQCASDSVSIDHFSPTSTQYFSLNRI